MHFALIESLHLNDNDCLVLGFFADKKTENPQFSAEFEEIITKLSPKIREAGDQIWQSDIQGKSLLLVHCGSFSAWNSKALNKRMGEITHSLKKQPISSATICLPALPNSSVDMQLQKMVVALDTNLYQMLDFKSTDKKQNKIEKVNFFLPGATERALDEATSLTQGIRLTRNLANYPSNVCTPTYLAEEAIKLADQYETIKTKVMDKEAITEMKMGAFLAVAKGSMEPPQFIEIQYRGVTDNSAPIVLVGKGVTFDSGGISLKQPPGMEEMKFDMAGAASVLGTIKACALMKLPVHIIGLIPTTENMPSGTATKPGDIVTSMSGKTIEIVNTDAEGRLILADALTYAERFNPKCVIDIATLTGAIIISLGHETTGLFTPDDQFAKQILTAAQECGDSAWRMPVEDSYQELIESPLADIVNSTADRSAGSITAACFLSRFTKDYQWAHLDIAGTAWVSGKNRNATGRPVSLLVQFIKNSLYAR